MAGVNDADNDQMMDIGSAGDVGLDDVEDVAEMNDSVGITSETLDAIRAAKKSQPGMFVSSWDADDDGVAEKDLFDPGEQVLTAAEDGDLETLKRLLADNPQLLKVRDSDQYTPLHRAAYNNHADIVAYLLDIGADPGWKTESGWTPLHCAACWGCDAVIAVLLLPQHHVDVNARSNGDLTPLHLALATTENPDTAVLAVKYLLDAPGIDINAVSGAGETPIMIARRNCHAFTELVEKYIANNSGMI